MRVCFAANLRLLRDPTNLTPENALLLGQLLDQEEKRVRTGDDDIKDKIFEPGKVYQIKQGHTVHQIYFTKLVVRRKKENKKIVLLGAESQFPDPMKKGTLYFKKDTDGGISVKTIDDKEPKTLTPEQTNKFFSEGFTFNEDQTVVITNNNENYKRFSAVTAICGYNTYIYQIGDRKLGEGGYGKVYDSPGKLEHAKDGKQMVYVSYLSKREEPSRSARKGKIIKLQKQESAETDNQRLRRQEVFVSENILLRESPETRQYLPTKKSTYQKKGMIGKTREKIGAAVQEKASGKNLTEVLKEKLSAQDRYDLTIAILQAMKEFHGLGKIHRDIKPDNLIVDISKRPFKAKVIDWGSAINNTKTTHNIAGTDGWMAPEMWISNMYSKFNAAKPDEKNDNFAIGLILRKLWNDSAILEREDFRLCGKFSSEQRIRKVASIEWLLGISIKKPNLSSQITNGLQPEQIEKLSTIMDGMTLTDVEKRMSANKALAIIDDEPTPEEKKSADEKPLSTKEKEEKDLRNKRYVRAEEQLGTLSKKMQLLFLSEAIQEVTRLSLSLSDEMKQFLQLDVFKETVTEAAKISPSRISSLILMTIELRDILKNVTPENLQQSCIENKKLLERMHLMIPSLAESKKIRAIESKGASTLAMISRLAVENHMDAKTFVKTAQPPSVVPTDVKDNSAKPKAVATSSEKSVLHEAKENNDSMLLKRR